MRSMPATTSHFYYRYPPDATGSEGGPRAEQSRRGGRKSATRRNITAACGSRTATGRSARAVGYCGAVPRLPSADDAGQPHAAGRTTKTGRRRMRSGSPPVADNRRADNAPAPGSGGRRNETTRKSNNPASNHFPTGAIRRRRGNDDPQTGNPPRTPRPAGTIRGCGRSDSPLPNPRAGRNPRPQ